VQRELPSGTVTFLFTDVEGSTRLLHELGVDRYAEALDEHRRVIRDACTRNAGVEVDTQGDAFFVAFPSAPAALEAAVQASTALASGPIRVRMGIHTGTPHVGEEGYVGVDVHRAARIAACGHGGQVLVSASTASLVGPARLRDLGEHRLKDLSAPERIYQLDSEDFPPLGSLYQTNLPVPSTPFLGRAQELSAVVGLLSHDDIRLLTLTGAGGTGKTRLALQAAAEVADRYPHGVWWVPLASLRDPELVRTAVEQALGATSDVVEHIGDRRMLLLLDNFEHVVEAASEVAPMLAAFPGLAVLVTSREPLHLTGEQEYPVPPLRPEEGVGFFLARARAAEPDFAADDTVAEICLRLDELPLALELAAARVKALSARQILERLEQRLPFLTGGARDLPDRQRTLRATIEWSHELLSVDERRLFARLAVFRGGCTLDAAESVAEARLDIVQALVDQSLVRHTDERFWMLETIREFAAACLRDSGEQDELEQGHAGYFLELAERAEPNLRWSGTPGEWLDRLDSEHDNLRAALDLLAGTGERQLELQLAGALSRFWVMRSHLAEGGRRLERALAADESPTAARARALDGAAVIALGDDIPAARRHAEEALTIHRAIGDPWGTAYSAAVLAEILTEEGDLERAEQLFAESRERFRELGDEHHTFLATDGLAGVYEDLGDIERARLLHEDNLRSARGQSNHRIVARSLGQLAAYAHNEGRLEDAIAMLRESLFILHDLGDRLGIADDFGRLARTLAVAGRVEAALRLVPCSEALYEETGRNVASWTAKRNEETVTIARSQLDEADFATAWEQGKALTFDEAVTLALDA